MISLSTSVADDYFKALFALFINNDSLANRYSRLHFLLDQFVRQLTSQANRSFPNLFSRLYYLSEETGIPEIRELQIIRIHIRNQLQKPYPNPEEAPDTFQEDTLRFATIVSRISGIPLSPEWSLNPTTPRQGKGDASKSQETLRMRCTFLGRTNEFLYLLPHDSEEQQPIQARIVSNPEEHAPFNRTIGGLQPGMQVNLLHVRFNREKMCYDARVIIVEPDFLIDISALSECFQTFGSHPLNYWWARLRIPVNSRHILLGNIANLFLDELLNESDETPVHYQTIMQKAFRENPLVFAACSDLQEKEQEFFNECRTQFGQLRKTIAEQFPANRIEKEKAILEPAFICEPLGIQGRLDMLSSDLNAFIELKSGKAHECYPSRQITYQEKHHIQMMLYYAVLQTNLNISDKHIQAFLLYSRYPALFDMKLDQRLIKQALDVRNRIVMLDFQVAKHNRPKFTLDLISAIRPEILNEKKLAGRFWEIYLREPIERLHREIDSLSSLERQYVGEMLTFICKEQYLAKCGGNEYDVHRGASLLWNLSVPEKIEAGEMIPDMDLIGNEYINDEQRLTFSFSTETRQAIPNFRVGDMVMIYRYDCPEAHIGNRQIIKGSIVEISASRLTLLLRIRQRNRDVLSDRYRYALERDYPDVGFSQMFRGIAAFLQATPRRKALLLSQRRPESSRPDFPPGDDIETVIDAACSTNDFYLLMGPPGTGKTSQALRGMVERFSQYPGNNILLTAYTNKAVDEICEALHQLPFPVDYIRIGQESTCAPVYRGHLLKNRMVGCVMRKQVIERIDQCPIFVGTLTSLCAHPELFTLKQFDVAIVDEASQILEPQLLPILCAKTPIGEDAIKRFILIGDHKQLPAIVLQSETESTVNDEQLNRIGIDNARNSLFERLYRYEQRQTASPFIGMLKKQGRMHPDICNFPARTFYNNQLSEIPLPHQTERLQNVLSDTPWQRIIGRIRLGFIAVRTRNTVPNFKVNPLEAAYTARLAVEIYRNIVAQGHRFETCLHLGIITPYRNQIATIRKVLQETGIEELTRITIDTVERYQGSQRDVILFSCCINSPFQLQFMGNRCTDNEQLIDRKLNVALTRARKQLFLIGNPELLNRDPVYNDLLEYIRSRDGWIDPENDHIDCKNGITSTSSKKG